MIREAIVEYLKEESKAQTAAWEKRHEGQENKLFVSDLGQCVRKAYLRINGYKETHPFRSYVLEVLRAGILWEEETARALRSIPGIQEQLHVGNAKWSGRIDFLTDTCIIEHKATNPANLRYSKRIPYEHHCLQLLAYQYFLEGTPNERRLAILYYRGWASWGEIEVRQLRDGIHWHGVIAGKVKDGFLETGLAEEMGKFEQWWGKDELPPKYDSPTEHVFACTRKIKSDTVPNCPYYGVCWEE